MSNEINNQTTTSVLDQTVKEATATVMEGLTVRDEIRNRLIVKADGQVVPNRDPKDVQLEKNILDQEYRAREKGEYSVKKADELNAYEVENPDQAKPEDITESLIKHYDAIKIKDKIYPVSVCKTATEVLDSLREGKYACMKFKINFDRSDMDSMETLLKDFRAAHVDLPRRKRSTQLIEDMVVVEPSINGFEISVFYEEVSDNLYKEIDDLVNWIEDLQSWILEQTIVYLKDKGADAEEIIKNQTAVSAIPKARRQFQRKYREVNEEDHISATNREESGRFADELNEAMDIHPLSGATVEFGIQYYTIEVTPKSAIQMGWKKEGKDVTYFQKGNVNGRILREVNCVRKLPMIASNTNTVVDILWSIIPVVLEIFEKCAREQLGYQFKSQLTPRKEKLNGKEVNTVLPNRLVCNQKNAAEVLGFSQPELHAIEQRFKNIINEKLTSYFKDKENRQAMSILQMLQNNPLLASINSNKEG